MLRGNPTLDVVAETPWLPSEHIHEEQAELVRALREAHADARAPAEIFGGKHAGVPAPLE